MSIERVEDETSRGNNQHLPLNHAEKYWLVAGETIGCFLFRVWRVIAAAPPRSVSAEPISDRS